MLARHLISEAILPVHPDDECNTALVWMDELKLYHLPVVDEGSFLGLISEKDLAGLRDSRKTIRQMKLPLLQIFTYENNHLLEVVRQITSNRLSILPVLDEKEGYVGAVSANHILACLSDITAIEIPGSILVVEVGKMDYILSEIAKIVESNNARILALYVTVPSDSSRMEVTLKINKTDIQSLIQTFNRFDYVVKASYSEDFGYYNDLKDRYESLMKYLNI
jgi:acetoin utilization protein AcuB